MRSLRLGESSWLSIYNGRRQTSPGGGKERREGGGRKGEKRPREKERRLVISVVSTTITVHGVSGVSGVSGETKRWSTFGQHMSRMCSGHSGTRGRKKNRGGPSRWPWSVRNYLRGDYSRDCSDTKRILSMKCILSFECSARFQENSTLQIILFLSPILSTISCTLRYIKKYRRINADWFPMIRKVPETAWKNEDPVLAFAQCISEWRENCNARTCAYE